MPRRSVRVLVMHIGGMRMAVRHRLVPMPMAVCALHGGVVHMPMVQIVMRMRVLVVQHFVAMEVLVAFPQVQDDPAEHQRGPGEQRRSERPIPQQDGNQRQGQENARPGPPCPTMPALFQHPSSPGTGRTMARDGC